MYYNRNIQSIMVHISVIVLPRGGVGRTTLVRKLGTSVAKAGHKVLLLDLDPQATLSSFYGVEGGELELSLYNVLIDPTISVEQIIRSIRENLDIAPAGLSLLDFEAQLGARFEAKSWIREPQATLLEKRLQRIADQYDYIFIDTPPSLGILTVNALTVAQEVIIPVSKRYDSSFKARDEVVLKEFIFQVEREYNLELTITHHDLPYLPAQEFYNR